MHSSFAPDETKIGFTKWPLQRYKQGRTWNRQLALFGAFFIPASISTASQIEAKIFQRLQYIRLTTHDDTHGEWFARSAESLYFWLIEFFNEEYKIDVTTDSRGLFFNNLIIWLWGSEIEFIYGSPEPFAEYLDQFEKW